MSEEAMKSKVTYAVNNKSIKCQCNSKESATIRRNIAIDNENPGVTLKGGEIATKPNGYEEDDGVSQLTFIDHDGKTSWINRRKGGGKPQVADIGDSIITSYVSEVCNRIADATGNILNGSDCNKHILTDTMSMYMIKILSNLVYWECLI